ncbi:YwdI family protein [Alkalibacillus salilacus]|uniref:YwdI family protein n=1 Tax=Alkalibacillus salilacus TaxID=284582 RepID=UPI0027D7CCB4|nr:YwdI family protein [Alkalibacillus salilacus]
MSVSYQQIIEKMKIELQSVDASSNEADLRAKMYAIRSLADVVLADEAKEEQTKSFVQSEIKQSSSETSDISPLEAKMMGIEQPSKSSKPTWHESDANGESIFDF